MIPDRYLGLDDDEFNEEKLKEFLEKRVNSINKPCWELHFCPYGPLVEYYPLPNKSTRQEAIAHNERLKEVLKRKDLTKKIRTLMEKAVKYFNPDDYPEKVDEKEFFIESCRLFGHICPVFFVGEFLEESKLLRASIEKIPLPIKNQVLLRDSYKCQNCGARLLDHQLIFDFIEEGGKISQENVQITCIACKQKG